MSLPGCCVCMPCGRIQLTSTWSTQEHVEETGQPSHAGCRQTDRQANISGDQPQIWRYFCLATETHTASTPITWAVFLERIRKFHSSTIIYSNIKIKCSFIIALWRDHVSTKGESKSSPVNLVIVICGMLVAPAPGQIIRLQLLCMVTPILIYRIDAHCSSSPRYPQSILHNRYLATGYLSLSQIKNCTSFKINDNFITRLNH